MRLYLVRHGTSLSNNRATYSAPDTPLAPQAAHELAPVADYLSSIRFDDFYASDLQRTQETARILGFPQAKPEPRLRERNFGVFIGLDHYEAQEKFAEPYEAFRSDPVGYRIPEGESFDDVCDRVWAFLDEVTARERASDMPIRGFRAAPGDDRNILVVCHFNIIAACLCWVMENRRLGHHLETENGGVLVLDIRGPLKMLSIERTKRIG